MRPLALKWRVSLVIAAALSIVIAAAFWVAYSQTRDLVRRQADQTLTVAAQAAGVVMDEDEPPATQEAALRAVVGAALLKRPAFCRLWRPGTGQNLYAVGLADKEAALGPFLKTAAPPSADHDVFFDLDAAGGPFRAIWRQAQTRGGPVYVLIGQSSRSMQNELRELRYAFGAMGGALVLGSSILVTLIVLWGLRPIGRTAAKLLQVTAQNVGSVTLNDTKVPSEILPFVQSVGDMLARLNDALRRQTAFISDASHELRTPLSLAKSTVQLALNRDREAGEYRQALAATLQDLRRMEHLTEELLTLTRMEETPSPPEPAEVDLADLLRNLAETYSPMVSQGGGQLVCDLQPALLRGEEGQLRRLFGNLIDNAIQHGPRGGKVGLSLRPDGPGWVSATVSDEGGRIPPEALPRLFDRFFRADPSRSHATGGAGLGLAIARQIALRHGGQITIRSEPKTGTCLTVRLPQHLPAAGQDAPRQPAGP